MMWDWATVDAAPGRHHIRYMDVTRFNKLVPISARKCINMTAYKAAKEWDELMAHLRSTGHTAPGYTFRGDAKYLVVA